ncbi:hypothetical protein AVEN_55720-1 [Araneus ventricosus]|uniref:Uncharacterized protein n=1 Tax=Araneus ventricosus TaxID=182803 RepID=A0A4Y2M3N3_ARAVE|nr:hypothetical protein AVEN_55720-1 [Araneus ventricosus]
MTSAPQTRILDSPLLNIDDRYTKKVNKPFPFKGALYTCESNGYRTARSNWFVGVEGVFGLKRMAHEPFMANQILLVFRRTQRYSQFTLGRVRV